jgi:fatty acid synthase
LVHPAAFIAAVPEHLRASYAQRAAERASAGSQRLVAAMCGGSSLYSRSPDRRFGDADERELEAATLLSDSARLSTAGIYTVPGTSPSNS